MRNIFEVCFSRLINTGALEMSYKDDDLLTVPEIITELRIHRSTWQKMVTAGTTPPIVKLGNAQRIRYGAYRDWLRQTEAGSQAA